MDVTCPGEACGRNHRVAAASLGEPLTCSTCGTRFRAAERWFSGTDFVIYDLETTGLYPEVDEFIQIAAVRFRDGGLSAQETFHSYARPRRRISSFIESYTGITNQHVQDAPRSEEVLVEFARWAGDATLIAHNGRRFDSKFLAATCHRHSLPHRATEGIDSIDLSRMAFGKTRGTGHSMDHLVERLRLGGAHFQRHDARGDVEILGRAVHLLRDRLELDHALNGVRRHACVLPAV